MMRKRLAQFGNPLRDLILLLAIVCATAAFAQSDPHGTVQAQHVKVSLLVPPAQIYPG
jgi:hypothetical protein